MGDRWRFGPILHPFRSAAVPDGILSIPLAGGQDSVRPFAIYDGGNALIGDMDDAHGKVQETPMTELLLILGSLAIRELMRSLPAIIWAVRCKSDSPNYKLPAPTRPGRRT